MRHLIKNITLIGALSALLFSCEKDGKKQEFYYPEPIVTGIYPTTGYTLSQVVINGENFGDRLEPVSVHFGDKKAEIVSCKNNRIIVVVPKDAVSGDVTLKVWQYEFDNVGKFTVVPKPTIISVSSSNTDCPLFAAENDVITITGISFGTNKEDITVKIGTKIAEVISIQDDEIQVRTPAGYGIGTVQINVKGYETENGSFLDPAYTGDLTIYALKNSSQPFVMTDDGLESECWAIPTEWQYNDKFYYDESGTKVLIRPLLIDKNYPDGCISLLCNQWANANHKHGLENAKMYQVSTLPAGTYKISCFVPEYVRTAFSDTCRCQILSSFVHFLSHHILEEIGKQLKCRFLFHFHRMISLRLLILAPLFNLKLHHIGIYAPDGADGVDQFLFIGQNCQNVIEAVLLFCNLR